LVSLGLQANREAVAALWPPGSGAEAGLDEQASEQPETAIPRLDSALSYFQGGNRCNTGLGRMIGFSQLLADSNPGIQLSRAFSATRLFCSLSQGCARLRPRLS